MLTAVAVCESCPSQDVDAGVCCGYREAFQAR